MKRFYSAAKDGCAITIPPFPLHKKPFLRLVPSLSEANVKNNLHGNVAAWTHLEPVLPAHKPFKRLFVLSVINELFAERKGLTSDSVTISGHFPLAFPASGAFLPFAPHDGHMAFATYSAFLFVVIMGDSLFLGHVFLLVQGIGDSFLVHVPAQ